MNIDLAQLAQNQFFTGAVSAGLIGAVAMKGSSLLRWAWQWFYKKFVCSLDINSKDSEHYFGFVNWIFSQKSFQNIKTLAQQNRTDNYGGIFSREGDEDQDSGVLLTPAEGLYFGWVKRRPIWVWVWSKNNEMQGGVTYLLYTFTFSFKNSFFKDILAEIKKKKDTSKIWIINNQGRKRKEKRPLDSIFLQNDIVGEIVADIQRFQDSKEEYKKRGINHARNYIFHGPAGTGKSSLVAALASQFDRQIQLVDAGATDHTLGDIYTHDCTNKIILYEDADVLGLSVDREKEGSVKLSTILNCLDGLNSAEGSISILTTNNIEKLDPALKRAGRIDKIFHLDYFSEKFACTVHQKFLDSTPEQAEKDIKNWFGAQEGNYIVPAALQEKLYNSFFNS